MSAEPRFLLDPYREWVERQGIPVVTGYGAHLLEVDVRPWARIGAHGAFVHLDGRGDFIDLQLVELPPAGDTSPQRHLFETVAFVLDGRGSTEVELPSGETHS